MIKTIYVPFDAGLLPLKRLNTRVFSGVYEHGKLRYVKMGAVEVSRMIYAAVRDDDWNTIPYRVEDEKIEESEHGFTISYVAIFHSNEIQYKAAILIEANNHSITFSMNGEALSSFKRNRIGICVLHPIDDSASKEATISRPDGSEYKANFPEIISPRQPFKDIRQMQWPVNEDYNARLEVFGDIFETEDQRNWSDNSYKTYSTPVDLPLPVQVKTGDRVEQKIVLSIIAAKNAHLTRPAVLPLPAKLPFPKIGYNRVSKNSPDNEGSELLTALPIDHYRVELLLAASGWKQTLADAIGEAKSLGAPLELVTYFGNHYEAELENFTGILSNMKDDVKSVMVLQVDHEFTPPALLRAVYPVIKQISSHIRIGYGTDGSFAELNRNPPFEVDYDFVGFSLTPQAHLNDTRTILENLHSQGTILKTIMHHIGPDKKVHVFITFKSRKKHHPAHDVVPADYDERLHGSFGAAWTLLAMQNFCTAQLSFYDSVGYRGIISGKLSELYTVLAELKAFKPLWIISPALPNATEIVFENIDGDRLIFDLDTRFFRYNL